MPRIREFAVFSMCVSLAVWTIGCGETPTIQPTPEQKSTATKGGHEGHSHEGHSHEGHGHEGHDHKHEHSHGEFGPHKGTLIVFGTEDLHLELVLDAKSGTLTAYPLDAAAKKVVVLDQDEIKMGFTERDDSKKKELTPYVLTLTKVDGEDKYVGQSDDLKGRDKFDAAFTSVKVKGGEEFTGTKFKFPEGNHGH